MLRYCALLFLLNVVHIEVTFCPSVDIVSNKERAFRSTFDFGWLNSNLASAAVLLHIHEFCNTMEFDQAFQVIDQTLLSSISRELLLRPCWGFWFIGILRR